MNDRLKHGGDSGFSHLWDLHTQHSRGRFIQLRDANVVNLLQLSGGWVYKGELLLGREQELESPGLCPVNFWTAETEREDYWFTYYAVGRMRAT